MTKALPATLWWLAPLHELLLSTVLSQPHVFADDTTLPVLEDRTALVVRRRHNAVARTKPCDRY
jgi:hypothetical protein